MTREQWKDIEGYEGLYQVSTLGRVKRVPKEIMQWNHQLQKEIPIKYPLRYLKSDMIKGGYRRVTLSKGNKQERFMIHKLVAAAFLENPYNLPHLHHKNHTTHDNRMENLEWVTPKQNEHYKFLELKGTFFVKHPDGSISEWVTQKSCSRVLKIPRHRITDGLYGSGKPFNGHYFSYERPISK